MHVNRRTRSWSPIVMGGLVLSLMPFLATPPAAAEALPSKNIALNPAATGYPSPLESDPGWGGGSTPWNIVDGKHTYPEWQHGLAFTGGHTAGAGSGGWAGQPCGPRQATIDFGSTLRFSQVVLWHHPDERHVPATAQLDSWDGSSWQPIAFTRTFGAVRDSSAGYGTVSDQYDFAPVSGSKVRWSFDNCGNTVSGIPIVHGWLFEFDVFAPATGATAATHVTITGGALTVETPEVGDFAPVTLDGKPKTTTATMKPFGVVDATGTGAGWKVTVQATQFAEVDGSGGYVVGGKTLPSASLTLDTIGVASDGTDSPPPSVAPGPYTLDGPGAVALLTAATNTGMGRYVATPGTLTLGVPGNAYARTYRSDVALSLVSGP